MRLNRDIALSRRRNGRWEFSARLFRCRPHSWRQAFPISFMAARYEWHLSVTTVLSDELETVSVFADEHVPGGDQVAPSTRLNVDEAATVLSEPFERFARRKAFIFCAKTLHGGEHRFSPDHIPIEHGPAFV